MPIVQLFYFMVSREIENNFNRKQINTYPKIPKYNIIKNLELSFF
jgi:hypothetical protein